MNAIIMIRRFDPESDSPESYWQEFPVSLEDSSTVLDALIQIREEKDGSLSLRCSCRSAICGSCTMRINGHAALACKTRASDALNSAGVIIVEPPGVMPVIKDLVVNFDPFWQKIEAVDPYLKPQEPEPTSEHIVSNEAMIHLSGVTACIMCGACVSDCTVMEIDPSFLGPAALAKAYRFTADPRDGNGNGISKERLRKLNEPTGIWDCTRCLECVQVCPKGVAPMDRIMALRGQAIEAGFKNSYGARHAEAFNEVMEHSGWLDEMQLVIKTVGVTNVRALIRFLPVGLRAFTHGKLPPLIHKPIKNVKNVRNIFKKIGHSKQG
jgi:succinate dehydrogenase / fumarate reductase iron-sulfur subunit